MYVLSGVSSYFDRFFIVRIWLFFRKSTTSGFSNGGNIFSGCFVIALGRAGGVLKSRSVFSAI